MASYPSFDPSIFLEDAENKNAQKQIAQWITDEINKPMTNRAIREVYAPGSTYKPLVGIAGLESGTIGKYDKINDSGTVTIGGKVFWCLEYREYKYAHGPINLAQALAVSDNIYFHVLGNNTGINTIDKWAKFFGLGEKTGIDIDQKLEAKGIRSNREYKKQLADAINKKNPKANAYGEWTEADTAQSSIGQLYNTFTPLQLANYISTLANGGKKFKPHVINEITKYDGTVVKKTQPEFEAVPVQADTINAVKEGMIAVANATDGTAVGMFNGLTYNGKPIQVAGKTGTAETGIENQSSNALFVCYAPADNPKIAVAVVIERGAWGSYAAPVARDILEEYFKPNSLVEYNDKIQSDEVVLTK
jgi:penicillin-binding protein 2